MKITPSQQIQLQAIGEKYNLKFMIIYGSFAKGRPHSQSDIDIGVLGKTKMDRSLMMQLYAELADVFQVKDLDLKSLSGIDPLFRYEAMRDSLLIFGDPVDYHSFKAYAFRDYMDSQSLFRLQSKLVRKGIKTLRERM